MLLPVLDKKRGKGGQALRGRAVSDRTPQARLEEAAGLAAAIDLERGCQRSGHGTEPAAGDAVRLRQGRRAWRPGARRGGLAGDRRSSADAGAAAQSRTSVASQGAGPHRPHPRNLRRPGADAGRALAGRTRPSRLPEEPAGPVLDPSRAAARRLRLSRRPGRDPDRGRPPHHRRAHLQHPQGAGACPPDARLAPEIAPARALSVGGAGRLHQCRQVDPVQRDDRRRGVRRGYAVRHARSDHQGGVSAAAARRRCCPIRWASSRICRPR